MLALGAPASAQVRASLVATVTSVQPGRPMTVALRLEQDAGWHTYWVNPGTGLATTIDWQLPAGWKAGEIQWPAPEVLTDDKGSVTGNGYEGEVLLPVAITVPPTAAVGSHGRAQGKGRMADVPRGMPAGRGRGFAYASGRLGRAGGRSALGREDPRGRGESSAADSRLVRLRLPEWRSDHPSLDARQPGRPEPSAARIPISSPTTISSATTFPRP